MAKSELLFECRTSHGRESSVQVGDSVTTEGLYRFGPDRLKRTLDDLEMDPLCSEKAPQFWYNLVQQYSRRNLTNPTDMLPAILGVAKQIEKYTGLTYIAGLWKKDLLRGLLWANDLKRSFEGPKPLETGVPSWSWASATGEKYWPEVQTPSPRESVGWAPKIISVSELKLVLRCRYVKVSLRRSPPNPLSTDVILGRHNSNSLDYGWDLRTTAEVYLRSEHGGRGDRIGWMMADDAYTNPSSHACCMALEIIRTHQGYPNGLKTEDGTFVGILSAKVWFLLVIPHPDVEGSWKRIGVGMSANPDEDLNGIAADSIFEGADNDCMSLS